ncbi:MAG TPA: GYD domain-containing protein [Chloroflexota bacterium]|nr:GYD domain-containing protein [Chloroflexota bacterium]
MPTYLTQFAYTPEAWSALVKRPEDRSEVLGELLHSIGGKLICFYYAFSDYDGVFIFEAPDETAAAGALLAVFGPGHNKAIKTTQLLTVNQALEAMKRAGGVRYRPPTAGQDDARPYHD